MATLTLNYRFTLPAYDVPGWDTTVNANFTSIDAILAQFNAGINLQGLWTNSTVYTAGMSVVDGVTGQIWACGITHTSAATPTTFATDRTNNPTYWTNITNPAATAAQSALAAAGSAAAALVSQTAAGVSATASATSATNAANSAITAQNAALSARGYIGGLTLSNDGGAPNTKLDIAAGTCIDSTNATNITLGAFTKTTAGSWAAGTGNNGMGQGLTIANSTWYHVFAIINAGTPDVYFDTSVSAANKPASTTAFRRIGSFKTNGSAQIIAFSQRGNRFDWGTPVVEFTGTPGVTTAVTQTLVGIPLGVAVEAILSGSIGDNAATNPGIYISSLLQADVAANGASAITAEIGAPPAVTALAAFAGIRIVTNTSQQIRRRINSTTTAVNIICDGYVDPRGTDL